jgi:hypothetical protein
MRHSIDRRSYYSAISRLLALLLICGGGNVAFAQASTAAPQSLDSATVIGRASLAQMPVASFVAATQAFLEGKSHAPTASLRFQVMPRSAAEPISAIKLHLEDPDANPPLEPIPIEVEADGSFVLPAVDRALSPAAVIRANLPENALHWRPLVVSAGEPDDVRRMGDLRLECIAKEAGRLNRPDLPFFARLFGGSSASECDSDDEHFFLARAPLQAVTLEDGSKTMNIEPDRVGESSAGRVIPRAYHLFEAGLRERAYSPPLGDATWSDDTLVRFHYVEPSTTASSR